MSNLSLPGRLVVPRQWSRPLAALLLCVGLSDGLHAQVPGGLDPAYQPPVLDQGAQVLVIDPVVVNGKIAYDVLVGGSFTTFNGASVNPLIRLNADGTQDTTFAHTAGILVPRENADVNALLVQPDGNIIAAAYGTSTAAPTLTRLKADGTLDASFTTTLPDGGVMAMAIQPGDGENRIIIAGNFYTVDGTAVTGLTRLHADGSVDASFTPAPAPTNASGTYLIQQGSAVLVQPDGKIVVAGTINTTAGVVYSLVRLNADGSQDTSFAPAFPNSGGSFQAIGLQASGQIVAAGNVSSIGGVNVPNIARFSGVDGTLDQSFAPGLILGEGVNQLAVQADGKILVSNNVGGGATLARLNADGSLDREYAPGFLLNQSTVTALALQPDGLAVASGTLLAPNPQGNQPNFSVARLFASAASGLTKVNLFVPGPAKIWLAPNGAVDQQGEGDNLANSEPVRATGLALTPGRTLTFSATGFVDNLDGRGGSGPDGDGETESESTQNGLSGVTAAGDALLGVFIDDRAADPTNANAPASLEFFTGFGGVPGGQDYTTLAPLLGQVFFIGDGKTSGGITQQVTVPTGSTHLAFGTVDYGIWNDNTGGFNVTVTTNAATATPLTATTLSLTGANLGAAVAKGTPLTFTATQEATGTLSVRVQASLTPTVESSWIDLPDTTNGGAGFLAPKGNGTYALTTTHYPAGNVSFRAIAASSSQTDSISNVLQSYAIDIALLAVSADDLTYTVAGQGTTNQVVPDDKITYSLTVHNFGFEPATGVVVQVTFDPVNTKLITKKVSDGGTAAGSVLTWNLPTLANGDHHTFTFAVKVNAGVDLAAGIHTGAGVKSAFSNGGQVYIDAEQVPEIQLLVVPPFNISIANNGLVKDGMGAYVAGAGKPLVFTFTVSNRTPGTVSNVDAYIPLPSGYLPANFKNARLINADGSPTMLFDVNGNPINTVFKLGAAINGGIDQNAVLVTIPSIAAGQFQQFTFTVEVPYSAAPGSDVTLPLVQLTGTAYDGAPLAYAEQGYQAQISSAPPAALPNVVLEKIVPTAAEIQAAQYLALKVTPAGQTPSPLTAAARELFGALSSTTGIPFASLAAVPAGLLQSGYTPPGLAFVPGLNPYVSRDNDPDTGASRYEVPSPASINVPVPYVTYLLAYFNAGGGAAAGITINDAVPPGLVVDPASILVKGSALFDSSSVLSADGRSLTFALSQVKPGTGGAILYHALVRATSAGGPQTGTTLPPISASLTTASLSNQVFFTPAESLLVTGKADASVSATENDPGDGTAGYNIFYRNTGGKASKNFVVVSDVPANSTFVSAHLLDLNQQNPTDPGAGQLIHDPVHENTGGKVIFELGRLVPHAFGFVQVVYKLNDLTPIPNDVPGLIHHYYVDGSTFPGTPILPSVRGEHPEPRAIEDGPHPRFGLGDLVGAIKTGLDNVGHAIGGFFSKITGGGSTAPTGPKAAPTLWVSRVVPLSVQENTDFTYFITIGNCGNTDAYQTQLQMDVPTGATFKSATDGVYVSQANGFTFFANGDDSILAAHQSKTVTVTFHATASAGSTMNSRLCSFYGFADNAYDFGTGAIFTTKASSYVYSAAQLPIFDTLKGTIANNAAIAGGIDPVSLSAGASYSPHLAAITPSSTATSVAHADYMALVSGATIVAQGGGNIVAQGGGNIVAQGGGNIVAQGGGNIVAQGGGNIVINGVSGFGGPVSVSSLFSVQGLGIVAQGGGNIVAQGGGNIVAQGGGNILNFETGDSLIATSALPFGLIAPAGLGNAIATGLIGEDGSSLIGEDGSSLISFNGDGIISQDGGGFTSQAGGGLFGTGGAALQVSGTGGTPQRVGGPIRRTTGSILTLGSTTDSVHLDFNNAGSLVFGVGGSQPVTP